MNLYPICLKLDSRPCCVIGGGNVALRKVKTLLKSSGNITVVSPDLCTQLNKLYKQKAFRYEKAKYSKKFIKKTFLIIAATDDQKVNQKIVADANKLGKLINVVDVPHQCNFYLPSIINKKGILLAISTQGAFPGLAKKIRKVSSLMIEKYADNFKILSNIRADINKHVPCKRDKKVLMDKLLSDEVIKLIEKKKIKNFKQLKIS